MRLTVRTATTACRPSRRASACVRRPATSVRGLCRHRHRPGPQRHPVVRGTDAEQPRGQVAPSSVAVRGRTGPRRWTGCGHGPGAARSPGRRRPRRRRRSARAGDRVERRVRLVDVAEAAAGRCRSRVDVADEVRGDAGSPRSDPASRSAAASVLPRATRTAGRATRSLAAAARGRPAAPCRPGRCAEVGALGPRTSTTTTAAATRTARTPRPISRQARRPRRVRVGRPSSSGARGVSRVSQGGPPR